MLFTTVNKRSWRIEVVDQPTAPVKLAVFWPSQNQEKSESALSQLSRGSNNAMWTRKSGPADPPETSTYKWPAARHTLIGPQSDRNIQKNQKLSDYLIYCIIQNL